MPNPTAKVTPRFDKGIRFLDISVVMHMLDLPPINGMMARKVKESDMPDQPFNPKVDDYLAQAPDYARPILTYVRSLLHELCADLDEQIKWSLPHFDYRGEMMVIVAAYPKHCALTFWKDALMADPRLKANGALPAAKRFMGKLSSLADLPPDPELRSFIKEAMVLNETGAKLPVREVSVPKDLSMAELFAEGLATNPTAGAVWEAKSDAFRRDYLIWINDAKTPTTQQKRVDEAVGWIAEGKARFWKYQK
jgi:uncharacterized protein YdeI (YjbR/CyaY-like superfamily)